MYVGEINMVKDEKIDPNKEYVTMVRYNDPGVLSTVEYAEEGQLKVNFLANVRGIAPGQSAVIYDGADVVAGGIILRK